MYDTLTPGTQWFRGRRWRWLNVFGRLEPGVSIEQARSAAASVGDRLAELFPEVNLNRSLTVIPITQAMINPNQHETFVRAGWMLAALVAVVLLVACANLANLLLARTARRTQEVAVRLAIGASRGRIARQLLTESLVLALAGGGLGLLLAGWAHQWLYAHRPVNLVQLGVRVDMDWRVLLFTFAVSALTAVLFGLAPAVAVSRADVNVALKEGGRTPQAAGGRRLRHVLIVGEVALSMVALASAGLFVRSLSHARGIDPGFDTSSIAVVTYNLAGSGYSRERTFAFHDQLLERLAGTPAVRSAAVSSRNLLSQGAAYSITVEGHVGPDGPTVVLVQMGAVTPGYFDTMRIPLRSGRPFTDADREGSRLVAIVNETMARRFWPDGSAVGRRFQSRILTDFFEIVGVVADSKYVSLGEAPQPFFYVPLRQNASGAQFATLVVSSRTTPAAAITTVRQTMAELDRSIPLLNPGTIQDQIDQALWAPRMIATLVSFFGGLAMALAVIGIYGVMAYSVAQRSHEIGLRMALGAAPRAILGMVVGQGLALVLIGTSIGAALGLFVSGSVKSILYGIEPTDPAAFVAAAMVLVLSALAACYVPARRAAHVDPVATLRGA
jgi:predicted permease